MSIQQLTPKVCSEIISKDKEIQCVDVREPYEYELGNIGFVNIPMSETLLISQKFDATKQMLIICKSGKRAEAVANLLSTEYNFSSIIIVDGGITAWKETIDDSIQLD